MCSTVQIYYEQIFTNSDESAARPHRGGAVSCVDIPALQSQKPEADAGLELNQEIFLARFETFFSLPVCAFGAGL